MHQVCVASWCSH